MSDRFGGGGRYGGPFSHQPDDGGGDEPRRATKWLLAGVLLVSFLLTLAIAALLVNITRRMNEGNYAFPQVVKLDERTVDPKIWGQNFPFEYDTYLKTADQAKTSHGGSEALPHTPTENDPRFVTTQSKLELDPRLVQMWKGYPFSVDYREKRGHAYMLDDQRYTERVTKFNQPGACLNCHASTYVLMKDLGHGDINKGFDKMNAMTYNEVTKLAKHPVACIDCHDPATMKLRITRPAFVNAITSLKAAEGIKDYDVNTQATTAEMRSYVCAQCHVEYYFAGDKKTLTFGWQKGTTVRDEMKYEDSVNHVDFTHELTGAKLLKAQHPEYELWSQGIHSQSGVGCADCHMPYMRQGAVKISDHQVRSPMLNINASCQGCHNVPEAQILKRVETIQDRHIAAREVAQDALSNLIDDLQKARQDGKVSAAKIAEAQKYQRVSSFFVDWIVSENSNGFHAPAESLRILNDATNAARNGQLALRTMP